MFLDQHGCSRKAHALAIRTLFYWPAGRLSKNACSGSTSVLILANMDAPRNRMRNTSVNSNILSSQDAPGNPCGYMLVACTLGYITLLLYARGHRMLWQHTCFSMDALASMDARGKNELSYRERYHRCVRQRGCWLTGETTYALVT